MRPLGSSPSGWWTGVSTKLSGVAVLIQATYPLTKIPLVWGRLITGHSEEDDYTDGTTDVPVEGGYGPNYGSATMTLEQMIKQYTGPDGGFLSRNGSP